MPIASVDQQLCFALYSATRAITATYRPLLAALNLTYPQYLVMLVLWEERRISVGRLGERLHLDSGTLSPLLKRLESQGLVRRERCASDERVVEVTLTPTGRRLERRAARIPRQIHDATGLTARDAAALRDAVRHLTDLLDTRRT